jgi:NAD(P)-dependent dehydrogenase (short-subunit alcohol dehydrogenase family)
MDLKLSGRRALVTGASQGIGRAIALRLAEEGCDLVLVARTAQALEVAAEDIRSRFQVSALALPGDLSRQAEVERIAGAAGEIDILVNNAGAIPSGDLQALDDAALRSAWDLKLFGYVSLSRALYPVLKARGGVIINIIGAAGEWLDPAYIAGSTGNAALMAFTRSLGKGASRDGMRVVGINPGPVGTQRMETRMRERAREQFGDEERWRELTKAFPFGRPAMPEEIAAAAAFLASPWSGYTTGSVLTIDGGLR